MSNVKSKAPSIPQWQQPAANSSDASTSTPSPNSDETPRSELIEQAAKFLQDDSIRNAPLDRKISFLESKGLQSEEIDQLLGVSRNAEASTRSNTTKDEEDKSSPDSTSADESLKDSSLATRSNGSQRPQNPSASSPSSTPPASTTPKPSAPREVPPIITYPEFLVQQSKPPPLVTLRSTLYTLYGAAGLGASLYGASEYLIKPMLASLTSARLDLAQTTTINLTKLNEKLEQTVSRIPPELTNPNPQAADSALADEDTDSITSDPTELFHRDVATQTSQDLPPAASSSAEKTAPADDSALPDPTAAVTTHHKRLETITAQLRDFASIEKDSDSLGDSMRSGINDLQHYLDGLQYSRSSYASSTGYGVYSTVTTNTSAGSSAGITKAEDDAISSFRAEIRGVKGALLSARNFPGSRARVGGMTGR